MADLQLNYNLKNTLQNKITVKTAYNLGLTRPKDKNHFIDANSIL